MLASTSRLVLRALPSTLARLSPVSARQCSIASSTEPMTVREFEKHCEESLHRITDYLDTFPEWLDCHSEFDVNYAMGVITAKISPEAGTYVINKQSPNLQIWLSSPISGPKRYDLSGNKWVYSHDNVTLDQLLTEEFRNIFKTDKIDFSEHI
uniref:ferroxidase n=1 Tax=Steinernema glaseri TaxID=37863 RepID=A0A1I7ZNG6_9BILA